MYAGAHSERQANYQNCRRVHRQADQTALQKTFSICDATAGLKSKTPNTPAEIINPPSRMLRLDILASDFSLLSNISVLSSENHRCRHFYSKYEFAGWRKLPVNRKIAFKRRNQNMDIYFLIFSLFFRELFCWFIFCKTGIQTTAFRNGQIFYSELLCRVF